MMLDGGIDGPLSTIYPDPAVHHTSIRSSPIYRLFNAGAVEKLGFGHALGDNSRCGSETPVASCGAISHEQSEFWR